MSIHRLVPCLVLLAGSVWAQPTLTADNIFATGDSSTLGFAVSANTFESYASVTGADHVWDYSGSGAPGPWTAWTAPTIPYIFQPAGKSIHSPFSSSEINEYALTGLARDLFFTWSTDRDTLYYDGLYSSSNMVYRQRVPYFSFPLPYMDSGKASVDQVDLAGSTPTRVGSVTRTWVHDGYGTLKLPYGTVSDVSRIRTRQVDSTIISTIKLESVAEELIWFRRSTGIPVLRIVKSGAATMAYFAGISGGAGVGPKHASAAASDLLVRRGVLSSRSGAPLGSVRLYDGAGKTLLQVSEADSEVALPSGLHGYVIARIIDRDGHGLTQLLPIP